MTADQGYAYFVKRAAEIALAQGLYAPLYTIYTAYTVYTVYPVSPISPIYILYTPVYPEHAIYLIHSRIPCIFGIPCIPFIAYTPTAVIALVPGRRPVQWSEVFDHFKGSLDKKTIVHIWKSVTNVTEVVALGYDTLANPNPNPKYADDIGLLTGTRCGRDAFRNNELVL